MLLFASGSANGSVIFPVSLVLNVIPATLTVSPLSAFNPTAADTDCSMAVLNASLISPSTITDALNDLTSPGALIFIVSVFPTS